MIKMDYGIEMMMTLYVYWKSYRVLAFINRLIENFIFQVSKFIKPAEVSKHLV